MTPVDRIPQIIHQVWLGPRPRPDKWMQTWRVLHPHWEYILWDEKRVSQHTFRNNKHLATYRAEKKWHGMADILRNEILFMHGGFVAPADSIARLCLDPLLDIVEREGCDCFTCPESHPDVLAKLGAGLPDLLVPLLGATRGNEFAGRMRDAIYAKPTVAGGLPWKQTGNLFVGEQAKTYPRLKVFPWFYFVPQHRTGFKYTGSEPVYCDQRWGTTNNLYERLAKGEIQ